MLSGVQMRGEVPSRVPGSPLEGSRLSRTHSEDFGRGTARQKRVAEKGRTLMQRFCQAFASAGLGWARESQRRGCGGRRQRRGGMLVPLFVQGGRPRRDMRRRPFGQVATMACGLDAPAEGWECGSVRLSSRVGLPAAVRRVPRLATVACDD